MLGFVAAKKAGDLRAVVPWPRALPVVMAFCKGYGPLREKVDKRIRQGRRDAGAARNRRCQRLGLRDPVRWRRPEMVVRSKAACTVGAGCITD